MHRNQSAVRVADKFAAKVPRVPADSQTVEHGEFKIIFPPAELPMQELTLGLLDRVARDYQSAGYPLTKTVRVLVQGTRGTNRSAYYGDPYRFIQLLPRPMARESDFYHTVVHEIAHWYHDNIVSGGFGNADIRAKYIQAIRGIAGVDPTTVGSSRDREHAMLEKLREEMKDLENEAVSELKRGSIISIPGKSNPFVGNEPYTRQYKVLKAPGKKTTLVEMLNPSPWDLDMAKRSGRPPPIVREEPTASLRYHLRSPEAEQRLSVLRVTYETLAEDYRKKYEGQRGSEDRYQVLHSEWVPTEYSKENSHEWFAELMTTAILHPEALTSEVHKWLKTVA